MGAVREPPSLPARYDWRADCPTGESSRRAELAGALDAILPRKGRVARSGRRRSTRTTSTATIWDEVNAHLGTTASSFPELVEQLGIMRFGHRPRVGDSFCGAGSIPFEAARLGCDVYASDLNPIGCMLTWGALNIVGGDARNAQRIERGAKTRLPMRWIEEITELGIEHDERRQPRQGLSLVPRDAMPADHGWLVPMATSWVISRNYRAVRAAHPDRAKSASTSRSSPTRATRSSRRPRGDGSGWRRWSTSSMERFTARRYATLRGDYRLPDGTTGNRLRRWDEERRHAAPGRYLPGAALLHPMDHGRDAAQGRPKLFLRRADSSRSDARACGRDDRA